MGHEQYQRRYLDPLSHLVNTNGFLRYASAEARVNLRVMEGSRQLCSDTFHLARSMTVAVGADEQTGEQPVSLQCEFTRSTPDSPETYFVVAEFEAWTGVGGGVGATVFMDGSLHLSTF